MKRSLPTLAVLVAAVLFAAPARADLLDAYTSSIVLSVGTPSTAGRALAINCTVSGNVAVTLADGSTMTFAVVAGFFTVPFSVTQVNTSGTTATATYWNLR